MALQTLEIYRANTQCKCMIMIVSSSIALYPGSNLFEFHSVLLHYAYYLGKGLSKHHNFPINLCITLKSYLAGKPFSRCQVNMDPCIEEFLISDKKRYKSIQSNDNLL
jgi:hypothetical protein